MTYLVGYWNTPTTGIEPATFDTQTGQAVLLKDILGGTSWGINSIPAEFWKLGGGFLFVGTDEVSGSEMWFTDGTPEGTRLVADIAPGVSDSLPGTGYGGGVVVIGGAAYFAATTLDSGRELWRTDGTAAGTYIVADLLDGPNGSSPIHLTTYKDGFLFSTEGLGGVWYYDGTEATQLTEPGGGFGSLTFAIFNDMVIFNRPLREPGELWISDGTIDGTHLLLNETLGETSDLGIYKIRDVVGSNSAGVFFQVEMESGENQLWITDGTYAGTHFVHQYGENFPPGNPMPVVNENLLFLDDSGALWSTDGSGPAVEVYDGSQGWAFYRLTNGGLHYFTVYDPVTSVPALWVTDGTTAGTKFVRADAVPMVFDGANILVSTEEDLLLIRPDGSVIHDYDLVTPFTATGRFGGDVFGSSQDDLFLGGIGANRYFLSQGGVDDVHGGDGRDVFYYGNALTPNDKNDGGDEGGDIRGDLLVMQGNYDLTFGADSLVDVEKLRTLKGVNDAFGYTGGGLFSYDITTVDENVAAGGRLVIQGGSLQLGEHLTFNGAAETDGSFQIFGGHDSDELIGGAQGDHLLGRAGNDILTGNGGDDRLRGGLGADAMNGGSGADTFVYAPLAGAEPYSNAALESTGTGYDTITGFNFAVDKIDLPQSGTALTNLNTGTVSNASFNADLAAAVDPTLAVNGAVLLTADGGDLTGKSFLIIDADGDGSYQADQDFVIELLGAVGTPTGPDFFA